MTEINHLFAYEANELLKNSRIEEAIELCKAGLNEYPDYATAYSILANAYFLLKDYDTSISIVKTALDRYPENISLNNLKNKINEISGKNNRNDNTNILDENEVRNLYSNYKNENIILNNNTITNYIHSDLNPELYELINNYEESSDLKFADKSEASGINIDDNYFSALAQKIGDGRIKPTQEIFKSEITEGEPYIVSETIAQIYEIQKAYSTAIKVYEKLCEEYPDNKQKYLDKIESLKNKLI